MGGSLKWDGQRGSLFRIASLANSILNARLISIDRWASSCLFNDVFAARRDRSRFQKPGKGSIPIACARYLTRRNMVQRDDPLAAALPQDPRADAVQRILRPIEVETAVELRGIGRKHLDPDVVEAKLPARRVRGAVVADVMVERALPVLLIFAARYEDHVGIRKPG